MAEVPISTGDDQLGAVLSRLEADHEKILHELIDFATIPDRVDDLAKILLEIEATGDRERAETWMKKYDVVPDDLRSSLKAAEKVPVDVDPVSLL